MNRFLHYELRTTDVDAARTFCSDLLGVCFFEESISVGGLPAQAAARGAPPHWLGHIGADDVVGTTLRFVQSGATPLGAAVRIGSDGAGAMLRDPFGAVVALTSAKPLANANRVAWHLLTSRDEGRAFATYAELFGWTSLETLDLGAERGRHVTFSWDRTTEAVGSVSNLASPACSLPVALLLPNGESGRFPRASAHHGGLALPVVETAEGNLVAPCDDPQGAAFGLH